MAVSQNEPDQDESTVSAKLISPAALGVVALLLFDFYNKTLFTTNQWLVVGFGGFVTLFALSHFFSFTKFGKAHAFYLYTYHWLLSFAMIFVVPTLSHYLYLWVMFMYLAEYFYQARGMIISSLSLLVTMVMGVLYQENGLTKELLIKIAGEFVVIVTVNLVMTHLAFGNRKKRAEMHDKVLKSEFEHSRMVALINSMSDGVIATDERGKILNYNAAALDLLDTNITLTGQFISDYLKVIDPKDEPIDIMTVAAKTNYLQRRTDLSMMYGDHDRVSLDISISRIARTGVLAKQQGFTFLLRDITLQKSLDEERDLFISEVSHELRTPLTIAEGEMSNGLMLVDKSPPNIASIKESVEKAHDQVVFLSDMVNDLSALSRAQRDDKSMDIDTFSIDEVLKELEDTYKPQADKKGLYFKLDIAPNVPDLTTCRLYFREIMQNFITNAIKYTEKGGITVKGQAIDRDNIIISVTDTGAGIAKSEQAKVYQKFWRSEDPLTRSTGGTGLGLFITAKLIQRIGGEVRLESKLKEGSTFSLIVPTKAIKDVDERNFIKTEISKLFN